MWVEDYAMTFNAGMAKPIRYTFLWSLENIIYTAHEFCAICTIVRGWKWRHYTDNQIIHPGNRAAE
jgi:hypothetical protein